MYAGQIVETAPAKQFFEQVKHPYSNKLFDALPSAQKRNQRLSVIKGAVAKLDQDFDGCRFVERCELAQGQCYEQVPGWHEHDQHGVRCHLFAQASSPTIETEQQEHPRSPLTEISSTDNIVLDIRSLSIYFPIKKGLLQRTTGYVKAVDDISLTLHQAETLALVGESGCGKTTVAKAILQLVPITNGDISYFGTPLKDLSVQQLQHIQASLQIVFQDPYSSMNPRMTIAQIIEEGIDAKRDHIDKTTKELKVDELLHRVGLRAEMKYRYPHEFSGGQRQRICIARALATDPEVIICDEPTSALDVSVQAQVLNLLRDIQHEYGLSYLFITHNISVVSYLAHRVAVMYLGKIVEVGMRDEILNTAKHPYTQALLAAVPEIEKDTHKEVFVLEGELPSATNPPDGCHFYQRCPQAMPVCQQYYPQPTALSTSHQVRCFLYEENNG
jgi:peptide/nickel transport system ATP-binding protein